MEGLFSEISIISPDLMDSGQINRCCEEIREVQLLDQKFLLANLTKALLRLELAETVGLGPPD